MEKVTVKSGQTLVDIALQTKGTLEAVEVIADLNGMTVTEQPDAGTVLELPAETWDRLMENYCRRNEVEPATALTDDDMHAMWQGGIGFMVIEQDFIIM